MAKEAEENAENTEGGEEVKCPCFQRQVKLSLRPLA